MSKKIKVLQTTRKSADYVVPQKPVSFSNADKESESSLITIYPDHKYQEILGFGGAFTEAAAVTINALPFADRRKIMNAYFHPRSGIGYSLCRTHINSCDFSTGNYAYVDNPNDSALNTFSIDRDKKFLIPIIHEAQKLCSDLKIFASPWSPPSWMKTNNQMNNGGKLKKEHWDTWARYIVKYLQAYEKEGITLWGITVQNEPKATQVWDSCVYTAEDERDFVAHYLGPQLRKNKMDSIRIIVWDHNKERVFERAKTILSDRKAAKYVFGVGFHWYSGDHFEALALTHEQFPQKALLFTEGSLPKSTNLSDWEIGEYYAHDIIGNINNWCNSWTDWNMVLDSEGGPNHVGNYAAAPIHVDTKNKQISFQPSYYYIAHFSKYIPAGSHRIAFSKFTDKLEAAAFLTPQGSTTVVILNRTSETISYKIRLGSETADLSSDPHSIMTLLF